MKKPDGWPRGSHRRFDGSVSLYFFFSLGFSRAAGGPRRFRLPNPPGRSSVFMYAGGIRPIRIFFLVLGEKYRSSFFFSFSFAGGLRRSVPFHAGHRHRLPLGEYHPPWPCNPGLGLIPYNPRSLAPFFFLFVKTFSDFPNVGSYFGSRGEQAVRNRTTIIALYPFQNSCKW